MSKNTYHQDFVEGNDQEYLAEDPNNIGILPFADNSLDQWTGGQDLQSKIAILPMRLDYDKKKGFFHCEEFKTVKLSCKLVAATTIWAIWTEQIGQPDGPVVVGMQPSSRHEMGLRLILDIDDYLYYIDCFGLMFKVAQSATRRAQKSNGLVYWVGSKQVSTRFGLFYVPQIEQLNEAEL